LVAESTLRRKVKEQLREAPAILRRKQVEARTGLRRSTIYERVAEGEFPAPINLGARAVGWLESEISAWIAARVAQSRKKAA
jgi:prophage regulatory protein